MICSEALGGSNLNILWTLFVIGLWRPTERWRRSSFYGVRVATVKSLEASEPVEPRSNESSYLPSIWPRFNKGEIPSVNDILLLPSYSTLVCSMSIRNCFDMSEPAFLSDTIKGQPQPRWQIWPKHAFRIWSECERCRCWRHFTACSAFGRNFMPAPILLRRVQTSAVTSPITKVIILNYNGYFV